MDASPYGGSGDNTLISWDVGTGDPVRTFTGHTQSVMSVAFSPMDASPSSGSGDNTLVPAGTLPAATACAPSPGIRTGCGVWRFPPMDASPLVGRTTDTLIPVGTTFATGDRVRTFTGHTDWVWSVAFSPDWTLRPQWVGRLTPRPGTLPPATACAPSPGIRVFWRVWRFSPTGRFALSGSHHGMILWDVATGDPVRTFIGHTSRVESVAFFPDWTLRPQWVLDNTLILWDVATGDPVRTFTGHTEVLRECGVFPDGRFALSGSDDDTLILWDMALDERPRTFTGHTSWVSSVAFSPDGRFALEWVCG
ncbi:MAG UNVERIFIED_CONTAM: WD40 repeat domain-containing protein [Anaerolineae bacterium]